MDVGALTPFLWGFEEREKLMEFYGLDNFLELVLASSTDRPLSRASFGCPTSRGLRATRWCRV
jgi:hypothetical protein